VGLSSVLYVCIIPRARFSRTFREWAWKGRRIDGPVTVNIIVRLKLTLSRLKNFSQSSEAEYLAGVCHKSVRLVCRLLTKISTRNTYHEGYQHNFSVSVQSMYGTNSLRGLVFSSLSKFKHILASMDFLDYLKCFYIRFQLFL